MEFAAWSALKLPFPSRWTPALLFQDMGCRLLAVWHLLTSLATYCGCCMHIADEEARIKCICPGLGTKCNECCESQAVPKLVLLEGFLLTYGRLLYLFLEPKRSHAMSFSIASRAHLQPPALLAFPSHAACRIFLCLMPAGSSGHNRGSL